MKFEKIIKQIKKVVPFKQNEFDIFAQNLLLIKLKKNEVWEDTGKICQHMGFVNSGMLRQYYLKDGNEFTDCFILKKNLLATILAIYLKNLLLQLQ